MGGYYEIGVTGPGRSRYRLFCILDTGSTGSFAARGFDQPQKLPERLLWSAGGCEECGVADVACERPGRLQSAGVRSREAARLRQAVVTNSGRSVPGGEVPAHEPCVTSTVVYPRRVLAPRSGTAFMPIETLLLAYSENARGRSPSCGPSNRFARIAV
jgi:hypothetical protein